MTRIFTIAVLCLSSCWLCAPAVAQSPLEEDDPLLESLGDDLLDDLDDIPLDPPAEKPAVPADKDLFDDLGDGEDLGESPSQQRSPIAKIESQMRRAEQLLARNETTDATQRLHEDIVATLDELIRQLEQQKQSQSSGGEKSQGSPQPQQDQPQAQPKSTDGGDGDTEAQRPEESTERVGEDEQANDQQQNIESLMKRVWGHLPERTRSRMNNASLEQFLPEYEGLIESYFERLAEEPLIGQ